MVVKDLINKFLFGCFYYYSFFIFCWRIIMDFKGFKCSSWNLKYIRALDLYSHECTWKKLGCGTVSGTPVTGCIHQSNNLFILSFALGEILLQRLHFPWVHRRVRLGWVFSFPHKDLRWWLFWGSCDERISHSRVMNLTDSNFISYLQDFAHERKLIRVKLVCFHDMQISLRNAAFGNVKIITQT